MPKGHLDLSDFVSLERLDCSHNRLTSLCLTNLEKLAEIECSDNYLDQFDYSSLNTDKLVVLHLSDNNFVEGDLSIFSKFANLQSLRVGNNEKGKIQQGIYNRFVGSLEYLRNLTKLKYLHISNTDINEGIKYLSDGIREIYYSAKERPESQQTEEWLEAGLGAEDYHFAAYLRGKGYNPHISRRGLEGDLVIEDFPNLEKLNCSRNQLTSLTLNNLPKLACLYASRNKFTDLTIKNCPMIRELYVANNQLESLDFLNSLIPSKLTKLHISNNNFPPEDIAIFYNFVNLTSFHITNNRFYGSLQSLRKLNQLENLTVADNELTSDLEFLPNSLNEVALDIPEISRKDTSNFKLLSWTDLIKTNKNSSGSGKSLLEEKNREVDLLALRIQELECLIRKQKEKIVDAYSLFAPEKNLLQKLIMAQLEFTKVSRQEVDGVIQYRRQRDTYYYELVDKLNKKQIQELEIILKNCEEMISLEVELEKKFNEKLLLLEEQKQMTKLDITNNLDTQKIKGIEKLEVFPTWFNDIFTYEPAFGKTEEKINYLKVTKLPLIKEKWEEIVEHFKAALNSNYPAAEVYNNIYTFKLPFLVQSYGNIEKRKIKLFPRISLDDHIKPYDIIKVGRRGGIYRHVAVYLGNGEVAHVNNPEGKATSQARINKLDIFLKGETEIEVNHPFIPFKRQTLIKRHIDIAVNAKYGKGKYSLISSNCEHFATMCVYGLGICRQRKINTINAVTKKADYLLQAIEESNKFFENLENENTKKVIELVDLSVIENFYTILQYLNRAISVVGASIYLVGEATEDNYYKKVGGTIAELVGVMEPISSVDSLGKLGELISALKERGNELIKKDNNGNLKEFSLLNDGPGESSGIKQRRVISKYRQGIPESEIENEITKRMEELKLNEKEDNFQGSSLLIIEEVKENSASLAQKGHLRHRSIGAGNVGSLTKIITESEAGELESIVEIPSKTGQTSK
ncbi:1769_t:CDS:10, partial [Racocetra persica]